MQATVLPTEAGLLTERRKKAVDAIERKVLMLRAGIKQSEIARRLGLRSQTVCLVVNGKCKSRRVEEEIAKVLSVLREALWPDRT